MSNCGHPAPEAQHQLKRYLKPQPKHYLKRNPTPDPTPSWNSNIWNFLICNVTAKHCLSSITKDSSGFDVHNTASRRRAQHSLLSTSTTQPPVVKLMVGDVFCHSVLVLVPLSISQCFHMD